MTKIKIGHEENEDHILQKTVEITLICKSCKKAFRKDLSDFDETDQYCPFCDNEFVFPSTNLQTGDDDKMSSVVNQEDSLREKMMKEHIERISKLDPR